MKKIYTVYKTINIINDMFYIGVHKTSKPEDIYLGSGKRLIFAIRKYGSAAFKKEILATFENAEDAYLMEKNLINAETLKDPLCYNLKIGGEGGFDYLNRTLLNISGVKNRDYKEISRKTTLTRKNRNYRMSEETKEKISESNKRTNKSRGEKVSCLLKGRTKSESHKKAISLSLKGLKYKVRSSAKPKPPRKQTEETKKKLSSLLWINNGVVVKRIPNTQTIPEGWVFGKKLIPIYK